MARADGTHPECPDSFKRHRDARHAKAKSKGTARRGPRSRAGVESVSGLNPVYPRDPPPLDAPGNGSLDSVS